MSKAAKPLAIIFVTLIAVILIGCPTVSLLGAAGLLLDAYPTGTSGSGDWVFWAAACALGGELLVLGFYLYSFKCKLKTRALSTLVLAQLLMVVSIGIVGMMLLFVGGALLFLTGLQS